MADETYELPSEISANYDRKDTKRESASLFACTLYETLKSICTTSYTFSLAESDSRDADRRGLVSLEVVNMKMLTS